MEFLSISAFLITLRETMEAALIIGILLAYLTRTDNADKRKDVWTGALVAILLSFAGAVIFEIFLGGFKDQIEMLFEGIVMVLASLFLTWMIIWMFKSSSNLKYELEHKVDMAINQEGRYALFFMAFIAVFREGIETVLFMAGIGTTEQFSAIAVSGGIGIIIAAVLAYLLFHGTLELNLKQFFNATSILLIVFAAGLFMRGIHEFQELGWFGIYGASAAPFWNIPLWDWSSFLPDSTGLGSILRSLFGYQDKPTLIELIGYVFYWVSMLLTYFGINAKINNLNSAQTA